MVRGIGVYTRQLAHFLEKTGEVTLLPMGQKNTRADVIHYPFFDLFFPTLPFAPWNKVVVTIHDVIPLLFPEHYPVGKRGTIAFKRQKIALKFVSMVITDSHASARDIEEHLGVDSSRIAVIPLAAQPNIERPDQRVLNSARRKFTLPKQYCLYVGDINYNKNIPQLIKMLKFLPDSVSLVCVGKNFVEQDIPEWKAIETQIALSNVADRTHLIPSIPSDNNQLLSALYAQALCYVQPSLSEGFGLPVLEAMQCRTPVVSTNTGSLPEVCGEAAILVEPTAEAMAGGVSQIISASKTARQAIEKRGLLRAQDFSWEKTAAQTIAVYRKVCGS